MKNGKEIKGPGPPLNLAWGPL